MYKLFVLIFVFSCSAAFGQDPDSPLPQVSLNDSIAGYPQIDLDRDIGDQLLSLSQIIAIAVENSPALKFQDENIQAAEYQVDFARRQWTQNISANTSYFYGNQNQVTVVSGQDNPGAIIGNGFRVGVNINVPLFEFTARQKRVGLYEHQLESYRYKKDELENELSRVVVTEYAKLVSNQRSLRIQAASREQARIQLINAEKDFKTGNIPVIEYTRLNELYTKTELEYEFWRKEFFTSFYSFEILVGVKMKDLLKRK